MIMTPALLLPLAFVDTNNINNSFDGNFYNAQLEDWQTKQCYYQKWQFSDTLRLQLISEDPLSDLKILNMDGSVADTVEWTASPLTLPAYPTYTIYEIEYPFANLAAGKYVIQQDQFEAEAIEVAQDWPNTVLIGYKNLNNNYSVIFSTGFHSEFRIEGWVGNYKPKNDRDVYNDQKRNLTQLNSVAYRQFTFYIGYKWGVPNKFADKVNIITQCNELTIDGIDYQPIQDAEFEVENNQDNNFIGGSIDIEPKINKFIRFVTAGNLPNAEYTPNLIVKPYPNVGADFNIGGVFRFNSVLWLITIYRISANPLTIRFGITPGGNEIGEILLNSFENTLQVNYPFTEATTVYVSGINDGDDLTIYLTYLQLDALPIPINPSTGTGEELGAGATMLWFEPNPGDFLLNWDMATGLGKPNTKWTKWCILGSNGTLPDLDPNDTSDAYFRHIGFDNIVDNYLTLSTVIGENQKLIPREALPAEALFTLSSDVNGSSGDIPNTTEQVARAGTNGGSLAYEMRRGGSVATLGKTSNMGSGDNFDVTPKTIVSLYIFKLVD